MKYYLALALVSLVPHSITTLAYLNYSCYYNSC